MIKQVGLGVPATFLAGSDYVSQKAFISVYHRWVGITFWFNFTIFLNGNRYRKYLELRDSDVSSYYINNYQRYLTVHLGAFIFNINPQESVLFRVSSKHHLRVGYLPV